MYSTCHQIVCDSDLRIAHYSSRWRLMITSEPLAIRKRYGVTRKYPFRSSGHGKPAAF